MKDTSFAFADSQIRAIEGSLLNQSKFEALVSAKDIKSALDLLISFGYSSPDGEYNAEEILKDAEKNAFEQTKSLLNDENLIGLITAPNDFQNLKAAVKALLISAKDIPYIYPTLLDTEKLYGILSDKSYDELPLNFGEYARLAYECAVNSADGQLIDCMLDKFYLEYLLSIARKSDNEFIKKYIAFSVNTSLIKIAYRASLSDKNYNFIYDALVSTDEINAELLASSAAKGSENLLSFIQNSEFAFSAELLKQNGDLFEKEIENRLIGLLKETSLISFGPEPVLAFYFAKMNEIKNIRILLTCKEYNLPEEKIKERMRELYV